LHAEEGVDNRERFLELDREMQSIKEEFLEINQDVLRLQEMAARSQGGVLVVMLSMAPTLTVDPVGIVLQLDGNTVSQHQYSQREVIALREGGVQRLYTGSPGAGEHRLEIAFSGHGSDDRRLEHQQALTIHTLPGSQYLELRLEAGGDFPDPAFVLREWHP